MKDRYIAPDINSTDLAVIDVLCASTVINDDNGVVEQVVILDEIPGME